MRQGQADRADWEAPTVIVKILVEGLTNFIGSANADAVRRLGGGVENGGGHQLIAVDAERGVIARALAPDEV